MKTVERHKKTDFGDVWYVNAIDGTYRFAVYKYDDDNDTIYLSNVLLYANSAKQIYNIINKLSSNLNDDGIMIVDTLASKNKIMYDLLKSDERFKYDFCCDTVYMHAQPKAR